jgi:hypothetical protein
MHSCSNLDQRTIESTPHVRSAYSSSAGCSRPRRIRGYATYAALSGFACGTAVAAFGVHASPCFAADCHYFRVLAFVACDSPCARPAPATQTRQRRDSESRHGSRSKRASIPCHLHVASRVRGVALWLGRVLIALLLTPYIYVLVSSSPVSKLRFGHSRHRCSPRVGHFTLRCVRPTPASQTRVAGARARLTFRILVQSSFERRSAT